jgi:LysR family transcriptional regulator, regulator for bpeEF and oprC
MDQVRAMKVFRTVVELGSFTRAAQSLNLTKASISGYVQQLEEHLRTKLLLRTTRRLSLTDDGTVYLEGARRVLSDIRELDASVLARGALPRGRLRVDVPAAAGRHVIAPALLSAFSTSPCSRSRAASLPDAS